MTAELDPIDNEARNNSRARRLPPDSACALCGETEVTALEKVDKRRVSPHVLESHHAAGRHNDAALQVVLCRNCHARATAAQWDAGAFSRGRPPSMLHQLVNMLRSLASFFVLLGQRFFVWAEMIATFIANLDIVLPDWPTLLPGGT